MEQLIGSRLRKEYDSLMSPCLFNLYAEHIMKKARLGKLQARIKIAGRNINSLKIYGWYYSKGRKQRGTKEPLDKGEGEEWKEPA